MEVWKPHLIRINGKTEELDIEPTRIDEYRRRLEPWLSTILQSEHLNLLIGSGFTTALAFKANAPQVDMSLVSFGLPLDDKVDAAAAADADAAGRGAPNIEDQFNAALALLRGLKIQQLTDAADWETAIHDRLSTFLHGILASEAGFRAAIDNRTPEGSEAINLLVSFLLTLVSRTASRERPHIFTTNYDRLIEFGGDWVGLRFIDRFVGTLSPYFRSSRIDIDYHYNPPGIRGEPRYLEGVMKLTKLHGSIDWRSSDRGIYREALPFGAALDHPGAAKSHKDTLMIYPNAAKEMATASYPYAELLRDFSSATSRPNSVLVTYGYGFGDEHINRSIRDMLSIPTTHVMVISFDDKNQRIQRFFEASGSESQMSLMIGDHFGDMSTLVKEYLPKPAIDLLTGRMVEMLRRRVVSPFPDLDPEPIPSAEDAFE